MFVLSGRICKASDAAEVLVSDVELDVERGEKECEDTSPLGLDAADGECVWSCVGAGVGALGSDAVFCPVGERVEIASVVIGESGP